MGSELASSLYRCIIHNSQKVETDKQTEGRSMFAVEYIHIPI